MMSNIVLQLILILFLVVLAGFFSSSETAYLSLQKLKVRRMLEEKQPGAKTVADLRENLDKLLTTVLIGTNYVSSLASGLVTALTFSLFSDSYLSNFTPFITAFFLTTFGQIIPKTIAGLFPEKIACIFAVPLKILQTVLYPVVWVFSKISLFAVWIVEKISKNPETGITEEDLRALIDVGQNEGTIEKDEGKMLNKLISFNNLNANDIMKHRSFLSKVSVDADVNQIIEEFNENGYSTLVVYKENIENVVGVINYKTILYKNLSSEKIETAEDLMTPVMYIPGTLSVLEVLNKFRKEEFKFAVVLDEQGQTSGVVTMEDIMKIVFGRMTNEDNYDSIPAEEKIKLVSYNTFLIPGELKLEEVNEVLNMNLESDECNTLGGWVLEQFGHLPSIGEIVQKDRRLFIVEDISQRRITSIRIILN
ncbi:MAG: hemolysin family protein [Treponema sp.]|nr:hemolysin family protein [Treponema sp.]MDY5124427.1 hemolysin family protein [Treponema sp.]